MLKPFTIVFMDGIQNFFFWSEIYSCCNNIMYILYKGFWHGFYNFKNFLLVWYLPGVPPGGHFHFWVVWICVRYVTLFPGSFTTPKIHLLLQCHFLWPFFKVRFFRLNSLCFLAKFQLSSHQSWQKLYPRPLLKNKTKQTNRQKNKSKQTKNKQTNKTNNNNKTPFHKICMVLSNQK